MEAERGDAHFTSFRLECPCSWRGSAVEVTLTVNHWPIAVNTCQPGLGELDNAVWLRRDDSLHMDMAELDGAVRGANLAIAWEGQDDQQGAESLNERISSGERENDLGVRGHLSCRGSERLAHNDDESTAALSIYFIRENNVEQILFIPYRMVRSANKGSRWMTNSIKHKIMLIKSWNI